MPVVATGDQVTFATEGPEGIPNRVLTPVRLSPAEPPSPHVHYTGDGVVFDTHGWYEVLLRVDWDPADATVADLVKAGDDWELAAVVSVVSDVSEHGVLLGAVRAETRDLPSDMRVATVMQAAPSTVRPSIPVRELAASMDEDGRRYTFVTTFAGRLLGVIFRPDLDGA